jgi:L-alanine-DL-glutamate epimerase-like enolase superfamily enzyme
MELDQDLPALPGIRFAMETAMKDLESGGSRLTWPSDFTLGLDGIPVNGLIWMGDRTFMQEQVKEKLRKGFRVLKLKVGAIDLEDELGILAGIRSEFGQDDLEIRLDANGAWSPEEALMKINALARFGIHSLEQPIAQGQPEEMAGICRRADIPIALDEELIGVTEPSERRRLLETISPAYIILKPGLLGGFHECSEWIRMAGELGAGWWITSALESNVGLSAIAQWTYHLGVSIPQGLGTGQLYENNIPSPLRMKGDRLWYREEHPWNLQTLFQD